MLKPHRIDTPLNQVETVLKGVQMIYSGVAISWRRWGQAWGGSGALAGDRPSRFVYSANNTLQHVRSTPKVAVVAFRIGNLTLSCIPAPDWNQRSHRLCCFRLPARHGLRGTQVWIIWARLDHACTPCTVSRVSSPTPLYPCYPRP